MTRFHIRGRAMRLPALSLLIALLAIPVLSISAVPVAAQPATPAKLSCEPAPPPATSSPAAETTPAPPATESSGKLKKITMGYVPVSIFAPVFVAKEKGYYAEQGLDVSLEPLPGGSDMVVLTSTGKFDVGIGGAGPAFWNAMAQHLPLTVIAPGHMEGNPVATPLMISKKACESGEITSVADLKGKRVAVNAHGATEFWLAKALGTAGLTLNDIDLKFLAFPDAVAALQSGALDASMVGEPLATQAEQSGIAVRLLTDFPVQGIQPTLIYGNNDFLKKNPDAATGLVTAYLKACRDLTGPGFKDPANLAIIEQYTKVPASLIADAVQPVYAVDGTINIDGLNQLQQFFRERDQLEYDTNLDPASFIDTQYVDAALKTLGP
ncbi:MAG TPA: ABC transporter substrate-binding protein [Thermomicrobiales bacterium]|nr:ABC transporter substrate-binding protein [Thermomicrobiales bacterium]